MAQHLFSAISSDSGQEILRLNPGEQSIPARSSGKREPVAGPTPWPKPAALEGETRTSKCCPPRRVDWEQKPSHPYRRSSCSRRMRDWIRIRLTGSRWSVFIGRFCWSISRESTWTASIRLSSPLRLDHKSERRIRRSQGWTLPRAFPAPADEEGDRNERDKTCDAGRSECHGIRLPIKRRGRESASMSVKDGPSS
jgi:hypothetical protein